MQPSEWTPGTAWRDVVQNESWLDFFEGSANNGIDVVSVRDGYHAVENDEPPACGNCGRSMADAAYNEYFEPWLVGEEPWQRCAVCGWTRPAGDWRGEFSFLVGAPAVTFNNWPELRPAFVGELRSVLGGRTGIVRAHL